MKKSTGIILSVSILLILLIVGVLIFIFHPFSQNVITSGSFTCPSGNICNVNGYDTCLNKIGGDNTQERIVTMRYSLNIETGSSAGDHCYVAYSRNVDGVWGNLRVYGARGKGSSSQPPNMATCPRKDPFGYCITETQSEIEIWNLDSGQDFNIYGLEKISSRTGCSNLVDSNLINKYPLTIYSEKSLETYNFGLVTPEYKCSTDWKILNSNGGIKESGIVIYSGLVSGNYQTGIKQLNAEETFMFLGKINYTTFDISKSCVFDTCNDIKTGYYKCENVNGILQKTSLVLCDTGNLCSDTPSGASCVSPFSITSNLLDANNKLKTGYGTGESIYFSTNINSQSVTNALVKIILEDSNGNLIASKIFNLNFPNTSPINVNFAGINNSGDYQIHLKISYSDKIANEIYSFRVANPVTMVIRAFSESTGTTLYTNDQTTVELRVFDDAGNPTSADTNLIASINGINLIVPNPVINSLGIYDYNFRINEEGLLRVTATINKFGFSISQNQEYTIKPSDIRITYTNIDLIQNVKPSSYTITFETKNPQDELINTQNIVKVLISSGQTVTINNLQGDSGKYSFVYDFAIQGGYKITVNSQANGFTSKSLESPFINIVPNGITLDCLKDSDCVSPRTCLNNKCVGTENPTSYTLLIIIGSLILLVFIIILVVLLRRKK